MTLSIIGPRQLGPISVAFLNAKHAYTYEDAVNDPMYDGFSSGERDALRALIACACLLLLVALSALVMMIRRSWLKVNGLRNKSRLWLSIPCLVFLGMARAVLISELIDRLNGSSGSGRLYHYDSYGFLLRHIWFRLFSWVADLLIFWLVLREINDTVDRIPKHRDKLNYLNTGVMLTLFGIGLAVMSLDASWVTQEYNEAWIDMNWPGFIALLVAYVIVALLLTIEILVLALTRSFRKDQRGLLIMVGSALCLGQVIDLTNTAVQCFASSLTAYLAILALFALADFVWMAKVLLIALLGWSSFRAVRAKTNTDTSRGIDLVNRSDSDVTL